MYPTIYSNVVAKKSNSKSGRGDTWLQLEVCPKIIKAFYSENGQSDGNCIKGMGCCRVQLLFMYPLCMYR